MPSYQAEITLPTTCEWAFEYLSAPGNLTAVTQPELQLEVEEAPQRLEQGSRIHFSVGVMGVRVKSIHEIVSFESPQSFVEEQIEGPFASWRHEHIFRADQEGRISVIDLIDYERPSGMVGMIMTEDRIRQQLDEGFAYRQDVLNNLLSTNNG